MLLWYIDQIYVLLLVITVIVWQKDDYKSKKIKPKEKQLKIFKSEVPKCFYPRHAHRKTKSQDYLQIWVMNVSLAYTTTGKKRKNKGHRARLRKANPSARALLGAQEGSYSLLWRYNRSKTHVSLKSQGAQQSYHLQNKRNRINIGTHLVISIERIKKEWIGIKCQKKANKREKIALLRLCSVNAEQ